MIEIYPENTSRRRPFSVEFTTSDNGKKRIRMFKEHFFDHEFTHPLMSDRGHPWNLDVYREVADERLISFWTESFLKFVVDAMNDKYEKDNNGK